VPIGCCAQGIGGEHAAEHEGGANEASVVASRLRFDVGDEVHGEEAGIGEYAGEEEGWD